MKLEFIRAPDYLDQIFKSINVQMPNIAFLSRSIISHLLSKDSILKIRKLNKKKIRQNSTKTIRIFWGRKISIKRRTISFLTYTLFSLFLCLVFYVICYKCCSAESKEGRIRIIREILLCFCVFFFSCFSYGTEKWFHFI